MKKGFLIVVILALAGFTLYMLFSNKSAQSDENKVAPLSVGKNSNAFNTSFTKMLSDYYALNDAFVEWDTVKVNHAAIALQQSADSLQVKELKADSTAVETAKAYIASVSSEAKGLLGETSIDQKRRALNMLTNELYDLIRIVRYDGQIVYHDKCPMAFGDSAEGYWLSAQPKIVNPYLGKLHPTYKAKMLGCGEIVDSLDFAKK
jgi:Protein of unknown function (DUF3347)